MSRHVNVICRAIGATAVGLVPLVMFAAPASAAGTATIWISTNASTNTSLGLSIFANANLTGANTGTPAGTVTFRAFGPGDTTCTTPVFTSTVAVTGTLATSPRFIPAHAGSYRWQSTYSGDATYASTGPTPCTDPSAGVNVAKAAVSLTAAVAPSTPAGIHATATVSGGSAPSGSVSFFLTGPDDMFCGRTPAFTSTIAVNGVGGYDSGMFNATRPGQYTWRVSYSGDADNGAFTVTPCLALGVTVNVTAPPATVVQQAPYTVWNQSTSSTLDGLGAWIATGADPVASAGQAAPEYLIGHNVRFAASTASATVGLVTGASGKSVVFTALGPDGTRYTTGIPFAWSANRYYFPYVYTTAPGVWAAVIYDGSTNIWTPAGVLVLPMAWGKLSPVSTTITNWNAGPARDCSSYPDIDVSFAQPQGYVGSTATIATTGTNAMTAGDCPATTSSSGGWLHYHLGS